ncbi:MAG TPA: tRNA pseudouridine synthase A [Chitinophagaceae bacterium]|nr:tRNA pseudouridine synthase A [Chitinophagaceae bacterium]
MPRYFLEVAYRGEGFAGFQVQNNALTVQGEINRGLSILFKTGIKTTGSSRTDSGVHARQNFVHFDFDSDPPVHFLYSLNAILGKKILIRAVFAVPPHAHVRFDALSRTYRYFVYPVKDPFRQEFGYYFPFPLDMQVLQGAAGMVRSQLDFQAFSKRPAQTSHSICHIREAGWSCSEDNALIFKVTADRFLRGMVRGLVGTMLKAGTGKISLAAFRQILESGHPAKADFSVPGRGLFLESVEYPEGLLLNRLSLKESPLDPDLPG